jgi:hypothetical protein
LDHSFTLYSFNDLAEKESLEYCIIGGLAAGVWGELRFTADIDFAVSLEEFDAYKNILARMDYELVFTDPKLSFAHF